jgi:type IV secretory pathway VirB4 component
MAEHSVLLFGGTGAGKTTLLASMLKQASSIESDGLPLKSWPDDKSENLLLDAIGDLRG